MVIVCKFLNAYSQLLYLFPRGPTPILVPNFCKALLQTALNLAKRPSVLNTTPLRESNLLFPSLFRTDVFQKPKLTCHKTELAKVTFSNYSRLKLHCPQPTKQHPIPRIIKNRCQRQSKKARGAYQTLNELPFRAQRRHSLQTLPTVLA